MELSGSWFCLPNHTPRGKERLNDVQNAKHPWRSAPWLRLEAAPVVRQHDSADSSRLAPEPDFQA